MPDAEKAIGTDTVESDTCTERTPLCPKPERKGMDYQTKQLLICGVLTVLLMAAGVVQVQQIEGWQILTSLYVIVQIVTTIGFGDFTVTSENMKLFCAFYVLFMLTFGAYVFNILIGWVQERSMSLARRKLKAIGERSGLVDPEKEKAEKDRLDLALASFLATFAIAFGTIFYATYEACTCSYGRSFVDGCKEDTFEMCVETGGYQKTWISSFYMSVITLTTVGFGDHSPRSKVGRGVGIVWMLFGVSFMANWFATLSRIFFEFNQKQKLKVTTKFDLETFKQMDKDGNGGLSRADFRGYFLVHNGLVSQEDLDSIDVHFYRLLEKHGVSPNGSHPPQLTWEMVRDCPSVKH